MNGQNNPPEDVPPSDLLLHIIERPSPSEVVPFPSRSTNGTPLHKTRIRVLLDEQIEDAKFRAKKYLKDRRKMTDAELSAPYGEKMMGDAIAKEILAVSCVMVDPIPGSEEKPVYPLLFRTSDDVRKLTSDEITGLFGAYILVQKRFGPSARELDDAEVNAWIERLAVGASELPLSQLDLHQLAELCMSLARRAFTFSQLLASQQQNSPINWESIPESWAFTTSSPSEDAASDTHFDEAGTITQDEAMAAAKRMIGRE